MTVIEHAYGIIPISEIEGTYEICMVQHRSKEGDALHWSFPKGHKNAGESDEEAAARELEEETGLLIEPDILQGSIVFTHTYRFLRDGERIEKTNHYYPIFIQKTFNLTPQEDEIHKIRWMNIPTAKQSVSFESMRKLLAEIDNWVQCREH